MKSLLCRFLLLSLLLCSNMIVRASDTTRVLFIGNSFTYGNMVPDIMKGIAEAGHLHMEYVMHAPGGATVGDIEQGAFAHMENPQVFTLIRQGNWDYVVVQDNQGRFINFNGVFWPVARTIEGHKRLMDSTMFYNSCATMVWFSGWAFKDGAPPYGNTGVALIDNIDANYKFMNDSLKQIVSPIGAAWKKSVLTSPTIELWDTDAAHASVNGSYLTASVLFCSLFKRDPYEFQFNNGIDAGLAKNFRKIAYETFTDSFAGNNEAMFTLPLSYSNGALVTSTGYAQYDYYKNGTKVATTASNSFTTTAEACYHVVAKTSEGCLRFSREFCPPPQPTSITEITSATSCILYPNPATDFTTLKGTFTDKEMAVTIYDFQGRMVKQISWSQNNQRIDLRGLQPGTYLLRFQGRSGSGQLSLVKE